MAERSDTRKRREAEKAAAAEAVAMPYAVLSRAMELVISDQRASYPEMNDGEALLHAFNTVSLETVNGDDPTAVAYRTFLTYFRKFDGEQ